MSDATSGTRRCKVCGGPIGARNTYGICGDKTKPECKRARGRHFRQANPEASRVRYPVPDPAHCTICGGSLRSNNSVGICTANPECARRNLEAHRRALGVKPKAQVIIRAGDTFGLLAVLEDYDHSKGRNVRCRCACGRVKWIQSGALTGGRSQSCGCNASQSGAQTRLANAKANPYVRAAERFNLLTALEDAPFSTMTIMYRCDCGAEKAARAIDLRRKMYSCGHARDERNAASKKTHGLSKHPLYGTWYNAVHRCHGPKAADFPNHGGRGIQVYEPWRGSPAPFIAWIEANLGPRPEGRFPDGKPVWTLDRIDNERGYEPGNLRWADKKTQANNRRTIGSLTSQRDTALAEVERLTRLMAS